MEYNEIIQSSLQSLKRNALRTFLTMLGIIIGISSVILIASIGQGAVQFITNELSVFGTNYFQITPGSTMMGAMGNTSRPLTLDDVEALEKDSGIQNIEAVAPFTFASRIISANGREDDLLVYGMTSKAQVMLKPDVVYGEFFDETHDDSNAKVAVIGVDVSEDFFGIDTNPVGESIRIDDVRFRVIGVTGSAGGMFGSFFDKAVNIPIHTMINEITGVDALNEIDVSVSDQNTINQTITDVEDFMRERRDIREGEDSDFMIQSFLDLLRSVQTITGLLTVLIAGISSISLVVGGVGVMNIMLVSVTERTREIGLLKALGAKERDILIQFLIESMIMSLIGGIIGIIIGIAGAFAISKVVNIPFILSIPWILLAVGISSLVGIVFGLYPARRAAHLSPIDALRHE